MTLIDYFRRLGQPPRRKASESTLLGATPRRRRKPAALDGSTLYQFKKDVLLTMGMLNRGVRHQDCEVLKRQMIFIQTQLFHAVYNDPSVPEDTREMLMQYHLKSVKATLEDRRHGRLREIVQAPRSPAR
ncbi:hypothetical protein [Pseudothauera nasutitermitis]|nr:hypothetical protein [Pseudothauera nasutitermitis]